MGIETPAEAGLVECNKGQNLHRDLVADVKRIQRAGLQVQGGFIVGFDSDTPGIFRRQLRFIQESGIVTAMVGLLNTTTLRDGYRRLLRTIYAPRPYYRRIRTLLREYRSPPASFAVRLQDLRTFVHAALRLGIVGRERFQFWWLISWTAVRRPALLRLAITLAICGHHFRLTTTRVL